MPSDYQFTGQETDSGTGLIYMKARYYDPVIGQFISPDTVVPDPANVYAYNRYMYAYGNPLKLSDPSGHEPINPDPDFYPCSYVYCEWNNFSMSWEVVQKPTGNFGRNLRSPEQLQQDTDELFLILSFLDPGAIDGTQAVEAYQAGDYLGAAISAASLVPFGDIVKLLRAGDAVRAYKIAAEAEAAGHMLGMDEAVEAAVQFVGDNGDIVVTGKGTNYQFMSSATNAQGQTVTRIGRLDVNMADTKVMGNGPHLNLEQHVDGDPTFNLHLKIDPGTVHRGGPAQYDYP